MNQTKEFAMKNLLCEAWMLIIYAVLGMSLSGCGNDSRKVYNPDIPATTGLMSDRESAMDFYEECLKLKRITNAERRELGIDAIELDDIKTYPNRELAMGKEIYSGAEGRLSTFLVIMEDHAIFEYLAGYDSNGDVTGCIRTGIHMLYAGDYGIGKIEGNTVKCTISWSEPDEWGEGIDQIYTITNDLQFIPFTWPPMSYPCEIPFMTYEKEDDFESDNNAALYCTIESVVCTGKSGNQYTLVIKGQSRQDCRKLKAAERTFLLEPLGKNAVPAGEAIKVAMPAIDENKTFEIKVKGLAKGKVDEKIFTWFQIKR